MAGSFSVDGAKTLSRARLGGLGALATRYFLLLRLRCILGVSCAGAIFNMAGGRACLGRHARAGIQMLPLTLRPVVVAGFASARPHWGSVSTEYGDVGLCESCKVCPLVRQFARRGGCAAIFLIRGDSFLGNALCKTCMKDLYEIFGSVWCWHPGGC